tara:strand:+ start:37900 stop:39135 length:1236 start_codon:yes stop_codon:yes gene_type:complete
VFSKFIAEVFILSIFFYLLLFKGEKTIEIIKRDTFLKYFLFYIIVLIIISFFSLDLFSSLKRSLTFFRFLLFIVFLKYFFFTDEKKLTKYLLITSIFLIILSSDIIYQYFFGKDLLGFPNASYGMRNSGFFGDEFIAGGYINLFFFPCLLLFKIKKFRIIPFLLLILYPSTILFTGERSSFFLMILGLILATPFLFKYKNSLSSLFISLILMSIVFLNIPKVKERIVETTLGQISKGYDEKYFESESFVKEYENNSKSKKNDIAFFNSGWGAHFLTSFEIFKDNPVTGSGLKTFRKICSEKKYEKIKSLNFENRCATHPHQIYLEILSETGIIGSSIFIILIIILIRNIHSSFLLQKSEYRSILLILTPIILKLWPLTTTGSFFTNFNLITFSFCLGLALSMNNIDFKKIN